MKHAVIAVILTLILVGSGSAQPVVLEKGQKSVVAGTGIGVGSRAMGMGGAAVATTQDATALYWNPAALATIEDFTLALPVGANVDGVDVGDIQKLWDLYDDGGADAGDFEDAFGTVRELNGRPVRGSAAVMAAATVPKMNIAVGAFGEAGFDATMDLFAAGAAPAAGDRIVASGGALGYYSIGAGYGRQISPNTSLGITVRSIEARRYANVHYGYTYTAAGNITADAANGYNYFEDSGFAVDLGMLARASENLTAGVVIRNVNGPTLNLGGDVQFDPTVNIGLTTQLGDVTWAFDIHNAFAGNDSRATLHLGAEKWFGKSFALRAGLVENALVAGLGARLGALSIDAAFDVELDNRVSLAVGLDF